MCFDDEWDDDQDDNSGDMDYNLHDYPDEGTTREDFPRCGTCNKPKYNCWCKHNFIWQMTR